MSVLDPALLSSIAQQIMKGDSVDFAGKRLLVRRTSANRLRTVAFNLGSQQYQAIEQNPDKPSRWGQLAREGHQVVQFKDVEANKFVGVAVDGKVQLYGSRTQTSRDQQ
ncbi:MAG TPA: hypothetical protein VKB58_02155 [Terriglobales bacterium]|nr:hypothetical protein [Terriglobales bacterium]